MDCAEIQRNFIVKGRGSLVNSEKKEKAVGFGKKGKKHRKKRKKSAGLGKIYAGNSVCRLKKAGRCVIINEKKNNGRQVLCRNG